MMIVYLFRHGQTDWNVKKMMQGHRNIPLNDVGRQQARKLKEKVNSLGIEKVWTSDLSRAYETAQIAWEGKSIEIISDARLREKSFGKAEGLSVSQTIEKYGEAEWKKFRDYTEAGLDFKFPDGESRRECLNRVLDVLEEAWESSENIIAISTHGGTLRSLLLQAIALGKNEFNHELVKIDNCALFKMEFCSRDDFSFEL